MIEPRRALMQFPLLTLPPNDWFEGWLASASRVSVEPGQTIFSINSPGRHVFLIISGKVRVSRPKTSGAEVALGLLRAGQIFGEYALLSPGLNTATCRVAEKGELLQLPLEPLRDQLAPRLHNRSGLKDWLRLHYMVAALRGLSALGFMSGSSFLPLIARFEKTSFGSGHTVQTDGLQDDRFFVIESGSARLDSGTGDNWELGPGDCFGGRALLGLGGLPSVTATSPLQCEVLARQTFSPSDALRSHVSLQTELPPNMPAARCHEWVPQRAENDCGVAALAMAARSLGREVTFDRLRAMIPLQDRGANLQELQRAAINLGLQAQAVRVGIDHLAAVQMPTVSHLSDEHYVVLFEFRDNSVLVGDPARGISRWSLTTLQSRWSGQLLLLRRV